MTNNLQLDPQETINKAFDGIAIKDDLKKGLLSIYYLTLYKGMLEVLGVFLGKNQIFSKNLSDFFNSSILLLSPQQKYGFDKTIEEEKVNIIKKLLNNIVENLASEEKQKLEKNLQSIFGNSNL